MTLDAIDRFLEAARYALRHADVDNRIKPMLELAPPDFADFIRHVNPHIIVTSSGDEVEYRGAVIRAKRP